LKKLPRRYKNEGYNGMVIMMRRDEGRRARGRPKKKWENCVNKDLSEKGLSVGIHDVHNRGNWKLLSKNADPT
jgi:hypothetical protein